MVDERLARALLRVFARAAAVALSPEAPAAPEVLAEPAAAVPAQTGDAEPHAELLREICDAMTREAIPERLLAASLRPVPIQASSMVRP